mmetsp:Transcript_27193/g.61462  ORF Transcript_27193/g.61462 Transcript_27193/m.61462 type:complete len:275 (-) Transcript_27193:1210-2034(-)
MSRLLDGCSMISLHIRLSRTAQHWIVRVSESEEIYRNSTTNRDQGCDVRCGDTSEVHQRADLTEGVNLIGRMPETTVDALCTEELERVLHMVSRLVCRILRAGAVEDIVHEHRSHDGIRRLLLEDLKLEIRHATICPSERLVVDDADGGGRGGYHGRHGSSFIKFDLRAPMLQTLRERIVWPLGHRKPINELDDLTTICGNGLVDILDEELATAQYVGKLLQPKRAHAHAKIFAGRGIGRIGTNMDICRGAKECDARTWACLAQPADAMIGAQS